MHPPPNVLRSSVVGCVRKYEESKKGVFLVRKGSYRTFNIVKIRKIWEKKEKIRKTWSMTKRSSEIFVVKMEIFSKKVILFRENFFRPPILGARFPPLA